jgi:hypothetical protein
MAESAEADAPSGARPPLRGSSDAEDGAGDGEPPAASHTRRRRPSLVNFAVYTGEVRNKQVIEERRAEREKEAERGPGYYTPYAPTPAPPRRRRSSSSDFEATGAKARADAPGGSAVEPGRSLANAPGSAAPARPSRGGASQNRRRPSLVNFHVYSGVPKNRDEIEERKRALQKEVEMGPGSYAPEVLLMKLPPLPPAPARELKATSSAPLLRGAGAAAARSKPRRAAGGGMGDDRPTEDGDDGSSAPLLRRGGLAPAAAASFEHSSHSSHSRSYEAFVEDYRKRFGLELARRAPRQQRHVRRSTAHRSTEPMTQQASTKWQERLGNLMLRFPEKAREELVRALKEAGGHGGKAAHGLLHEREAQDSEGEGEGEGEDEAGRRPAAVSG